MDLDLGAMPPRSPPSPDPHPSKRQRASSPDKDSPLSTGNGGPTSPTTEPSLHDGAAHGSKIGQSSSFRNVSACNRCRLRKNRCDQKLPSCASCEKARVACVGYDPITKREIPRSRAADAHLSYVYYLETRVDQLEALLRRNNIQFPPSDNLEYCSRPGADGGLGRSTTDGASAAAGIAETSSGVKTEKNSGEMEKPAKIARHGGGQRHLGSANGISFARVVFAAVQSSVGDQKSSSDKTGVRPYRPIAGNGGAASSTSMRDSFFGLHTRPNIRPAEFPPKDLAIKLVELYFEHANPQIPVLHRDDFMQMFNSAYAEEGRTTSTKVGGEEKKQAQPEEYHASAVVHLEACLSNSGGGLEELQAVLLLANFALLRPVPPGLWYIVGVAVTNEKPIYAKEGGESLPAILDDDFGGALIPSIGLLAPVLDGHLSLSVPAMFEGEYNTSKEVNSPSIYAAESREDEERVYVKVAEAGQKILRLYRQLHLVGLVNYTYLATHHLFMAGISYLYAIWHSHVVRSRLTMDEVDFTILAATSVFTDLIEKCPPAEACRDAFDRTAKATIKMANSTGGFGQVLHRNKRSSRNNNERGDYMNARDATANRHKAQLSGSRTASSYTTTPGQESYNSHETPSQIGSMQGAQSGGFRLSMPNVKTEQDGYSMLRSMPQSNLSAGSISDAASLPDNSAIDPVLLPSPGAHTASPVSVNSLTPQSTAGQYNQNTGNSNYNMLRSPASNFTPSGMNYSDLQGMDFLQGIQEQPNGDGIINNDLQMDMGFGLGWEGMHHDFSDGQQVDLFDGFFFGGQQGGG
ncbi:hypothetical protein ABKA04_009151 [Annulohypoxylon sp. FPYF3050]